LRQEPSSDSALANDNDSNAIPFYQSSRKPVNFDNLSLNSAHQQHPTLSRIPVLNSSVPPPSSYYHPPSPYNSTGVTRRERVGGHHPSAPAATKLSHFVANESKALSPGKAGIETLPRDDKNSNSNGISDNTIHNHHPST